MMNYAQITEQIEQLKIGKKAIDVEKILKKFSETHENIKKVKVLYIPDAYERDSVGEYLEAILKEYNFSVGRFTSFAIKRPCGHILLNGKSISQKEFARMGEMVLGYSEKYTQMEFVLLTALHYFSEKKCDYIILPVSYDNMGEVEQPTHNENQNMDMAVQILEQQGVELTEKRVSKAIQKCKCEGRFEILKSKPYFIADGADNEVAVKILMAKLQYHFPDNPYIFIVGCLQGEYQGIVRTSASLAQQIITITPPEIQNALPGIELAEEFSKLNPNITNASSIEEAVEIAGIFAEKTAVVVAFGTTAIIDKYKKILQ